MAYPESGAGGSGGGFINIAARTMILGLGSGMFVAGGAGGNGLVNAAGGGGGGGGIIHLLAENYTDNGAIFAYGGGAGGVRAGETAQHGNAGKSGGLALNIL